jgi:flagellin-like hook-associated protein FlgL
MSSIPGNLARVPNMLASRLALSNLSRANVALLHTSEQIATGRAILRPSDDIIKAATISVLDDRLDRSTQVRRNLSHAAASLNILDTTLASATELAEQARTIASQQVNVGSTATERASQATIIDQLLHSLLTTANTQSVAGYIFGGSQTSRAPVAAFGTGFRYLGQGPGLTTDLGPASGVPITLGATPISGVSSRVQGSVDLNPALTPSTTIASLNGARGTGISLGTINLSIDGSTAIPIDLAGADTIQDITSRIAATITQYETDNSVTILGPGGVSVLGGALNIDVDTGHTLQFSDLGSSTTAQDLGLTATTPFTFNPANETGLDTAPRLTWETPIAALQTLLTPLGSIQLNNAGRSATVDLSTATSLQDIRNLIEGTDVGVRVRINAAGTGIDIYNEVSAGSQGALSISEVPGSGFTATRLGIRSFSEATRVQDLNFGRGVSVVHGVKNPTTGLIDQALNDDFEITLGDAAGTVVRIDLRPEDLTTVQGVLDRINSQLSTALLGAGLNATDLVASVGDGGNGIQLVQNPAFPNALAVKTLNNSAAATDLGLLGGTWDATSATFTGQDRAKVRVDDLFTRLIDLRDSLRGNSTTGITLAGEDLATTLAALVETRGTVGGYARRVDDADVREADRANADERTRSELRDVDYTEAASRFALLQTQLEAGLRVTALSQSRSLLDFLT